MDEFRLFLEDLKPSVRRELLRFLGIKSAAGLKRVPLAIVRRPPDNVEFICHACVKKRYWRKGAFTVESLSGATHVKTTFGAEHMWVKVKEFRADSVLGTVANVPLLRGSPGFGEEVEVPISEVEDALFENATTRGESE